MTVFVSARSLPSFALLTFTLFLGVMAPLQTASAVPTTSKGDSKKAKTPAPVAEKTGKYSRAVLVRAWRLDAKTAAMRGAPDGLGFDFLFIRQPPAKGLFTLAELRDFTLDGQSYKAQAEKLLQLRFEPRSEAYDSKDFPSLDGKNLAEAYGVSMANAMAMRTLIFGSPLPKKGTVRVTVQIGWGEELEKIEFVLELADLKPAALVPVLKR
jgi:hypothetical protein